MSYILDALLKADLERQRQAVPGLNTVQIAPSPGARLHRRWPLGAGGAMLLAGLLLLAWNRLEPPPAPEPAAARPAAPPTVLEPNGPAVASVVPSQPAAPVREARREPPDRRRTVSAAAEEKAAPPGSRLYNLAELPPALQEQARHIRVAGYAHAGDPDGRLAIINDRAWREGDEVTTGLKVERISDDGVIFNLKGYRFRKGGA